MRMFGRRKPPPIERHPGGLTREHVIWAYRLLLDREPESEDVIGPKLAGSRDTSELRRHLMTSREFRQKNRDYAHTNDPTVVIKELHGGVRLFVDLADHVIGLNIVRDRYEVDEMCFVRSVLKRGDIAVDAGAHIGFFTVQMADAVGPSGRIYAFEPVIANADLLQRSILENRFENRVELHRAAVGAATGSSTLTLARETLNTGGAYMLGEGTSPLPGHETQTVDVVALDQLCVRRPVRLIKMDVEGAEPLVLRGAATLLTEDRPVVLSELHPTQLARASNTTSAAFLEEARRFGYRAHYLQDATVGPPIERAPDDVLASFVLVPL